MTPFTIIYIWDMVEQLFVAIVLLFCFDFSLVYSEEFENDHSVFVKMSLQVMSI